MRACKNCRFADKGKDGAGETFYFCRWLPPRENGSVPYMKPFGYCGQFKLAVFRWLVSFARPVT